MGQAWSSKPTIEPYHTKIKVCSFECFTPSTPKRCRSSKSFFLEGAEGLRTYHNHNSHDPHIPRARIQKSSLPESRKNLHQDKIHTERESRFEKLRGGPSGPLENEDCWSRTSTVGEKEEVSTTNGACFHSLAAVYWIRVKLQENREQSSNPNVLYIQNADEVNEVMTGWLQTNASLCWL